MTSLFIWRERAWTRRTAKVYELVEKTRQKKLKAGDITKAMEAEGASRDEVKAAIRELLTAASWSTPTWRKLHRDSSHRRFGQSPALVFMLRMPRLAISATRGGLGKTTLSIGIISAWRKRGRRIAVFKKGPDFIDAGWLGAAAGRHCYNLDLFMMEQERILWSFATHTTDADGAVIEGNRGLYDGVDQVGT
jgi:hypothetical protein